MLADRCNYKCQAVSGDYEQFAQDSTIIREKQIQQKQTQTSDFRRSEHFEFIVCPHRSLEILIELNAEYAHENKKNVPGTIAIQIVIMKGSSHHHERKALPLPRRSSPMLRHQKMDHHHFFGQTARR